MLRQNLSQKQLQKLSPQQIQFMQLLQVPMVNLEQRIKEELEANPALEEGSLDHLNELSNGEESGESEESFELEEYVQDYIDDDPYSYKLRADRTTEESDKTIPIAMEQSFHELLEAQLQTLEIEDNATEWIARQLIGSIDEDGYLRRDLSSIVDDLMFTQNIFVDEAQIEAVLKQVQTFDPPGVGARDLRENLLLQLQRKAKNSSNFGIERMLGLSLADQIVEHHFELLSKKHFAKLKETLYISDEELKPALDEILKLNPRPTNGFASGLAQTAQYVTPDFLIRNRDGELELHLNTGNTPELHVNANYQQLLHTYSKRKSERSTTQFIREKIEQASWFIDAIRQREQTMYKTMFAILEYQYDYFLSGDQSKLRPMILKDIAQMTNLDISTVSRVVNSKFVQTDFGTKRLKDFFSEGIQMADGEEVSTIEVKGLLRTIIAEEDKRKPYSDEKLKNILLEKGYNIARRTVAKYREQLNLPVARLRKAL